MHRTAHTLMQAHATRPGYTPTCALPAPRVMFISAARTAKAGAGATHVENYTEAHTHTTLVVAYMHGAHWHTLARTVHVLTYLITYYLQARSYITCTHRSTLAVT